MRRTLIVLLAVLVAPSAAGAAWSSPGAGGQFARAITLPTASTPSASVSGTSVTVSWSASSLPGGGAVAGYTVLRYSTGGVLQTTGSGCSGTIAATSCTEANVPAGTWRYAVRVRQGSWDGAESGQSTAVTVTVPTITVQSGSPAASLPATLTAALTGFTPGQTVSYRLDNPTTGTLLSATTVPATIPSNGSASATITLPSGVDTGPHTLYAVGSGGNVASASIAIDSSFTTPPFGVTDTTISPAVNRSLETAFSDGLALTTGNWSNAFAATRYMEFDMNAPVRGGLAVSGATFNFRRAAAGAGEIECFYFEVRRASTGAVLATHGSSAAPVACVTGTTQTTVSTPVPSVTSATIANDLRIRVYERESGFRNSNIDLATVSGTTSHGSFALYPVRKVDAAGGAPAAVPWPLAAADSTALASDQNWPTAFSSTAYLEMRFPAYVPATATVKNATFRHSFRPSRAQNTACWYAELYSGGSLIATHGSTAAPISCATGSGYTTDLVTMASVNTPARANDLTVRAYVYVTGGGNRRTEHDLGELSVRYGE